MKKQSIFTPILALLFTISACRQSNSTASPQLSTPFHPNQLSSITPVPSVRSTRTATHTLIPIRTRTRIPTLTPAPVYSPTLYPTYNPSLVNARPTQAAAICPPVNSNLQLAVDVSIDTNPQEYVKIAKQALDNGASLEQVALAFDHALGLTNQLPLIDLTGDGVPELIIGQLMSFVVVGCENGSYKELLVYSEGEGGVQAPGIVAHEDMNRNGIPDVVVTFRVTTGWNTCADILEWNGSSFSSQIEGNHGGNSTDSSLLAKSLYWYESTFQRSSIPCMNDGADVSIRDLDGNGTKELILEDTGPKHYDTLFTLGPWRGKQVAFTWNGIHFLYSALNMDPPTYRFQAVQDADRLFLMGQFDQALQLYQAVIFDDKLAWWSPERMANIGAVFSAQLDNLPTPTLPPPPPNEYPALSAYARYRIVLNHLNRGWINDASTVYSTLREKYPATSAGYPYVQLADQLWSAYQESNNIRSACIAVTEYVDVHPELLQPLGGWEHGDQSHIYSSWDICPFH